MITIRDQRLSKAQAIEAEIRKRSTQLIQALLADARSLLAGKPENKQRLREILEDIESWSSENLADVDVILDEKVNNGSYGTTFTEQTYITVTAQEIEVQMFGQEIHNAIYRLSK